jgi:hypothetical protein
VPVGSLAGGGTVIDSDPGAGEQWGRAGGRTLSFHINVPGNFDALSWGETFNTRPTAAFDGSVTSGTAEELTFSAGQSDLLGGIVRWTGSALMPLATGPPVLVQTRFTLTVTKTSNGSALPLVFVNNGVNPGIDVLAAGDFSAVLFFEAQHPNTGIWTPLLTLYDSMPTPFGNPPGTTGPVMTGFSHGFYFVAAGLSLEDHDANMVTRLNSIKGDTAFLRIEVPGQANSTRMAVDSAKQELISRLNQVQGNLNTLLNQGGTAATPQQVQSVKDELQQMLLILFGLMPCPPEAGPLCTSATFINEVALQSDLLAAKDDLVIAKTGIEALQAAIGNLGSVAKEADLLEAKARILALQTAVADLHNAIGGLPGAPLEVEIINGGDAGALARRLLVKTSQGGTAVAATLARIMAIYADSRQAIPATTANVVPLAVTELGTGLLEVLIGHTPGPVSASFVLDLEYNGATASKLVRP